MKKAEQVQVENINTPGQLTNVNVDKYQAMKAAFLKTLPKSQPGITQKDILTLIKPLLPNDLFPQGKTSGWWSKTVQLDLEAKGLVKRENCKPLRWYQT